MRFWKEKNPKTKDSETVLEEYFKTVEGVLFKSRNKARFFALLESGFQKLDILKDRDGCDLMDWVRDRYEEY
jgi:hypothetical protein